ncbi:MAG: nucleotide exchange factor GrpE [Candidatus Fermentibacteraceae bacterium]|nr:nucleotide exchange factor GrpE [Candidatus Fermentibacteraceae bacterium]
MGDPRRAGKQAKDRRRERVSRNSDKDVESAKTDVPEEETPVSSLEAVEKERDDLLDRFQRLAAEFDNYRKRQARDFGRLIEQGRRKIIEELLTVLDNFDRARTVAQGDHSDKEVVDGIMQTSEQLQTILEKEGLETVAIEPGDIFDPNIHEAMVAEAIDYGDVDVVLEVFQKGYYFGQDLLRPARVKVGKVSPGNGDDAS